jgi:hypothetical protein
MSILDRIDRLARQRLAVRLRRSHGDRSEATQLIDKELTAELAELWLEHRTTLAATQLPPPAGYLAVSRERDSDA